MERLLHTPEGVRDVYGEECKKKKLLKGKLEQVLHTYGYEDIETPTFEYFDVFSKEIGTTPSKDLYKFFDREGNTMVLRPDFTPSVARAVSMYFAEEARPIRLCYSGSTFINSTSYRGRLKEDTEMGVEYIGDMSPEGDGEILALVIDLLLASGLREFQISIGQVEFFKGLLEEANIDEETAPKLRNLISQKNHFGVEELLKELDLSGQLRDAFINMPSLFGGTEVLDQAVSYTDSHQGQDALERLWDIYHVLEDYGYEKYVSFDLGMLSKYNYYTGIIFQGFTYGSGEPIVKGGRYDHLQEYFGKADGSVGFVLLLENLMNALTRQNIALNTEIPCQTLTYTSKTRGESIAKAQEMRHKGINVKLIREGVL